MVGPTAARVPLAQTDPVPPSDPAMTARLDRVIDDALVNDVVGATVLVAEDGKLVYRRAAGLADREAGTPMRTDTLHRYSSLTKPIVTTAALALLDRGKLRFDDPVTRYIPDFRPKLPDGREPTITIRQLMTHTAGLTYGFFEGDDGPYTRAGVSDGMDQPGRSMVENLRRIASVPLSYEPGTAWGYSVANDVLGEVVSRAANIPLPEVVERLVTGPLGMTDTAFVVRDASRLATPYAATPQPVRMSDRQRVPIFGGVLTFVPGRVFDTTSFASGGAGMIGTAIDFLTLLETLRSGGGPVLSSASVAAMTANAIGNLEITVGAPGWGYGLGVAVLKNPDVAGTPQTVGTWRWGGVYGHNWFVDPMRRISVVALSNAAVTGNFGPYPDALRNAVYGA